MDLQAVSDKLEIHEQLARYARGVDTRDWDLFKSVFTDDAELDYSSAGIPAGTRDQIAAIFEQAFVGITMAQHIITNIEVDLAGDTAKVRAMFLNPMQIQGMADQSCCGGFYVHDFVRTSAGWKSAKVVEHNVWFQNAPR